MASSFAAISSSSSSGPGAIQPQPAVESNSGPRAKTPVRAWQDASGSEKIPQPCEFNDVLFGHHATY